MQEDATVLFELIDKRYLARESTIVTSNKSYGKLKTTAITSRTPSGVRMMVLRVRLAKPSPLYAT